MIKNHKICKDFLCSKAKSVASDSLTSRVLQNRWYVYVERSCVTLKTKKKIQWFSKYEYFLHEKSKLLELITYLNVLY